MSELSSALEQARQTDEYVRQLLPNAEMRVSALEQQVADRLASINTGFGLTDTLMDHRDAPVTLQPRFASLQNAIDFSFSAAEDYAPEGSYLDLALTMPGQQNWWSEPKSGQFTRKVSVYANIAVGGAPHPNPKPVTRIAMLHNVIGAHQQLMTNPSYTPDYSKPRLFLGKAEMESFEIKGQSWGITNYDDLVALVENELSNFSMGTSMIRIINLGNVPIHVKGFWIIHHAEKTV